MLNVLRGLIQSVRMLLLTLMLVVLLSGFISFKPKLMLITILILIGLSAIATMIYNLLQRLGNNQYNDVKNLNKKTIKVLYIVMIVFLLSAVLTSHIGMFTLRSNYSYIIEILLNESIIDEDVLLVLHWLPTWYAKSTFVKLTAAIDSSYLTGDVYNNYMTTFTQCKWLSFIFYLLAGYISNILVRCKNYHNSLKGD